MAKRILPLSDLQVRNAKPTEKDLKIFDGGGLFLLVTTSGGKLWRFKYRFGGSEKLLTFGAYPQISLSEAREKREAAKKLLANDVDPGDVKRAMKSARDECVANSFEVISREWINKFSPQWSKSHSTRTISLLERDLFPWIGKRPISEISTPELLSALHRIESRGAIETAYRAKQISGQIFRYAVTSGRAHVDPSAAIRPKEVMARPTKTHYAAITDPKELGTLLRVIDNYSSGFVVKSALKLLPLVFVRPGELCLAEWSEFNLEEGVWSIPAEKMKMKQAHLVPLSRQAIEILKELQPLTGASKFVFPNYRSFARNMTTNAILVALRSMGYEKDKMTAHGFRAAARTILDEILGFRPDIIEHQLAHAVKDPNGRAYNRTSFLEDRKKMMQQWADYLDGLKDGAKVLSLRREGGI